MIQLQCRLVKLAIVVICALVAAARADRVVIVETRGAPALPTLAQQVTVHAGAQVTLQHAPDADPLTFAEQAAQIVDASSATLVVWVAPVDRGYLVFVAGRATGRAMTELVRIDAALGAPEIERTIALKIAGLLDAVVIEQQPVVKILEVTVAPNRRAEWRIETSGALAYDREERGVDPRVELAVGRSLPWRGWTLAPMVGGYWQPSGTIERAAGRASLVELGGTLGLDVAKRLGPLELFARPAVSAGAIVVRGIAEDGRHGRTSVFAPAAGAAIGARWIVKNVRFGASVGCDFALIHRELVIDDNTVVDLGVVRLHVGLAMTVSL